MTRKPSPDAQYRTTTDLTGSWQFVTDPDDEGRDAGWYAPGAEWPERAHAVDVPHTWQEDPAHRDYTGTAWYRRTVDLDPPPDREVRLRFGAVDFETTVWVNGERVGRNRGGYLPFEVDATGAVTAGENTVVLAVHDPEDLSEIPHGKQGEPWYTRVSGPWQRVDVVTVPDVHVEGTRVTPDLDDDTATFEVDAATGGTAADVEATVTVSRDDDVVVETTAPVEDGSATATVTIPDADYWTPETPALYDVEVALSVDGAVVDRYGDYFGMRSVSWEDGDLYLNGEPFTMRGALDQAFYPDTYYRPRDLATFEREIRAAKELGFNLLRKHIKPAHPEFLELADRLGILVWEEPANPKRYTDRSKRLLREQLEGMIERDYNRPSVIAWSIYNEEWGIGSADDEEPLWTDEDKQDHLEALYHETRTDDPTRLVCDNSGWAHVATDINDYHEYFVAPDRLDAWRDRLAELTAEPAGNYGDARTDPEAAPLVVSEFGTWGLADVPALLDHYDGEPHWFAHDFLPEGLKRPAGVEDRFADGHVSDVFDSLSDLAAAWQERELQSLAPIVADMREHDDVAGYVLTELSDIEWEFNGVLDYLREEKGLYDEFARVNAPVTLYLDPATHVAWSGESVPVDVVVVNDGDDPVDSTVTWETPAASGALDVRIPPNDATRAEAAFTVEAPPVDGLEAVEVAASLEAAGWTATRSLYVAPRDDEPAPLSVYAADDGLHAALGERGYETVADPAAADVALVADPDAVDGPSLVVPGRDGHLAATDRFEYTDLPERESWNLCACLVYQDLLDAVDRVPGWAFEGLYPYGYVADPRPGDDVAVGYTEGWLANSGAVAMVREAGDESTGVCTLRVTDSYGDHPVATAVVDRLLAALV